MLNEIYSKQKAACDKALEHLKKDFGTLRTGKVNISILQKNTRDRGTSLPASAVAGWGFAIPSGSKTILLEKIAAFSAFP